MMRLHPVLLASLLTAACSSTADRPATPAGPAPVLSGILRDASGAEQGKIIFWPMAGELHARVMASGLTPGAHGMHLHAVGSCIAPGFTSAGGHWNPDLKQHGHANPMGPHRGDLPQLMVSADGKGDTDFLLAATKADLMDADGTAIVIHAAADDGRTDPSGNSGARVLCAEIR